MKPLLADPRGWPVEEGPQPVPPLVVLWDGDWWRVEDVDVLGRWLLVHDEDDYESRIYMERYVDPAEIDVPEVRDGRREQTCRYYGTFDRILHEVYMPAVLEGLKRDWHAVLFGDGKGEGPKGLSALTEA